MIHFSLGNKFLFEDQVLNKKDDKTIQNYNSVLDNFIDFCQTKDLYAIEKIDKNSFYEIFYAL